MVCMTCINNIENWDKFKRRCIQSNDYLLNKVPNVIVAENAIEPSEIKCNNVKLPQVEISVINQLYDEKKDQYNGIEPNLILYKCEICKKEFDTCIEHLNHQDEHNGEQVFKCSTCNEVSCISQLYFKSYNYILGIF